MPGVPNSERKRAMEVLGAAGKYIAYNRGLFSLGHFAAGNYVEVNLLGWEIEDVKVSPDSYIAGQLTDGQNCLMRVVETDCPEVTELVGREIGLSVRTKMNTPRGLVELTLRSALQKNGLAAVYLPEQFDPRMNYESPNDDEYIWPHAKYGRVSVNGEVLFDWQDNAFAFVDGASETQGGQVATYIVGAMSRSGMVG